MSNAALIQAIAAEGQPAVLETIDRDADRLAVGLAFAWLARQIAKGRLRGRFVATSEGPNRRMRRTGIAR